ncbi:hypothetical protein C8R45DRAFT_928116 [Mycena sanguinolenta]|nr:hypothetical protein C8R45DRAFT_928116 [Mycena sanguinolenta]
MSRDWATFLFVLLLCFSIASVATSTWVVAGRDCDRVAPSSASALSLCAPPWNAAWGAKRRTRAAQTGQAYEEKQRLVEPRRLTILQCTLRHTVLVARDAVQLDSDYSEAVVAE